MTTSATPILLNLASNVAANTLTALQISALQQALLSIAPTFPGPDETAVSLPPPDESLAREWIAALYAITQGTGGTVSGVLARAWATNAAPLAPGAAVAIGVSVNVTPGLTGKLKARISGVVTNNDSTGAAHPFTLALNTGAAAGGAALITQAVYEPVGAGTPAAAAVGLVVDLDKLTVPFVAPVGTPLQVNATILGSAFGGMTIPTGGLQLEVEEASA